jgi:hypothetical protein
MRQLGATLGLALIICASLAGAADAASLERTYPVGNEPFGVTIDPADGRIYVANSDQGSNRPGSLSVVDPASTCSPSPSSPCVSTIALASPATMSALDRGLGRLFVTTAGRALVFVDVATQTVVNTIPGAGGLGVAVDEATHHVYAAAVTSLSMVDGVTGSVLHTATAGSGDSWWAVALDAGAHRVYVTNLDTIAPSLVILDSDDLSLVGEVPLPEVPRLALAVDTARQLVYVGGFSSDGRLYVVDANTQQIATTVDLESGGSWPFSATLVAAEDRLYVSAASSFGPNSIVVLDLATLQAVQRISLPWLPGQTALHTSGRLYVAGFGADVLAAVLMTNSAPVVSVTISPSSPRTSDVLQTSVAAHDADGDALTFSYEWLRNGAPVAGATGPSLDLSVAGHGDRDDTITVRVRASDGQTTSVAATASVVVANTAPTASVILDVTAPTTNQVITATATSSDADGDALTYTFTWKLNGGVRSATSGPNASSLFDLSVAGNGDRGQTVSVEVRVSDGTLDSAVGSASAVVVNSSPTITVSLSDTSPRSRDVLVATATAQDADADPLTLTYTWRVNGVTKEVGPSDRFDLAPKGNGDKGDVVTVIVTASDGAATATADASATVTR